MMTAAHLRQVAEDEAKRVFDSSIQGSGIGGHIVSTEELARASQLRADADRIKHNIIIPARNIFECPNSPSGGRRAVAGIKGAARSLEDTGKGILALSSLPVLLAKLGCDGVESLVKWEDKLGVKDKYIAVKKVIKALFEDTKYDWENPEEYRKRQQAVQAYKQHMLAYNRAFNAERYHCEQEEEFGYVTMEALQFVFGEEIFKVVGKGIAKATKVEVNLEKGAQELEKGVKLVEGATEIVKGTDKLLPGAYGRFPRIATKFAEHGSEWTSAGIDAYYKRAVLLADSKVGGDILGFTGKGGWIFKMNSKTGEFLTIRPNGKITTFFRRLSNPVEYWAEQIRKHGL